ncbi:competence type IV pilus major pilin ComGC [Thermosipho atlanticus]|uniref:Prepilin-type N-terminal cleavage/methylation domain-containing protein n=1 Tax=Thermosipho atlanticus DSM 15807 TaxID=1123380 RepID=A0A1M5TNB8_9BACT|nr:type II secretion system protein [Thermosipho atlanticus]SHH52160.1 prepilin-type N-terminal cleavage/methylation domain-containing protein [Thermosipho atlanticus DSM 15807]
MRMRKGFTLIELLIVLAIIASLMGIVTPVALNAVKKAKATQVAANFRNIKAALESYVNVEQNMPLSLNQLKDAGYLNTIPSGFSYIYEDKFDVNGTAIATITYTAGDIDINLVAKVNPEVKTVILPGGAASGIAVTFQKWW